jgi:predicted nucleotidyltransferase
MTTQIQRGDRFLGYPVTKLKTFLALCFEEWGFLHPMEISNYRSLDLSPGACAAFMSECQDRGFFEMRVPAIYDEDDSEEKKVLHLSRKGLAVATASARKRATKVRAKSVLDKMIVNAAKVLSDPSSPLLINQIWVFGSFIDETKADVGDLDVVVTHSHAKGWIDDLKLRKIIDKQYPGILPEGIYAFDVQKAWVKRMIYGRRRNPLVSEVKLHDLVALHCPCRLVFDAKKGGAIVPEDFPFHPQSAGKADTVQERLVMPDLNDEVEFTPTSAAVLASDRSSIVIHATAKDRPPNVSLVPAHMQVDGRFVTLVSFGAPGRAIAEFAVKRNLVRNGLQWRYTMEVEIVELGTLFVMNDSYAEEFACFLSTLLDADMLRLASGRSRMPDLPVIELDIRLCRRALRMANFAKKLKSFTCGFEQEIRLKLLPDEFQFGILVLWNGDHELSLVSPSNWRTTSEAGRR